MIGADIEGSVLSGGTPGSWKVEGIGEDFVPSTLNAQVIDEWIRISDAESFLTARRIARVEGILLCGSSGTCLAAAFSYALPCTESDLIVALCPDTGRNYLSKMYDDLWMSQQGFTEVPPEQATAGDLLALLGREEKLIHLRPEDSLQRAAETFKEHGISQLPVMEDGKIVGAIQEITIVHALHRGVTSPEVHLREIIARPMPQVEVRVLLEEVYRLLLAANSAVTVVKEGRAVGLITRSDLMEYYDCVAMRKCDSSF